MTARVLHAAVIGGGMIAAVHRRAILASGGVVAGVLGSSPERAAAVAAQWDTTSFVDLDALLAANIDVVHVCSPNATHLEYALAAVDAGLHVVCEKPLATTVADAALLAGAAANAGVVATVPFVYRYHPLISELRARRMQGRFGRWNALHGSYLQDWMLAPSAGNWRVDSAAGGASRAFADIGTHWCDLVEFVSGERIAEVSATTSVAVAERPATSTQSFSGDGGYGPTEAVTTEDIAIATFLTEAGVPGNVVVSQVAAGRRNRLWFELDGADGSAVFDQENPESAWLGHPDGATLLARGAGELSDAQKRLSFLPGGHPQGYQDAFSAFVADTYEGIRTGRLPDGLPTFEDGARAARIVDAVLGSALSRAWAPVR
ncbi:Gfo/Idh/MocA family protein [Amycolatopsis pigmentata]|uniref:Gfo/Idh/MocA family protein n=1 Tax=Amycolatopsis pigmentata TaxID=450801 RepID=A0ABW5G5R2_9PSEU